MKGIGQNFTGSGLRGDGPERLFWLVPVVPYAVG